jgi:hypothetical protein
MTATNAKESKGSAVVGSGGSSNSSSSSSGETRQCVNCSSTIDSGALSFEQKLIDDEDFCRRCWDDIMNGSYDEQAIVMPKLK